MPINPNILLQGQVADIGKAVSQGFETYNQVQAGKLNQQKLQQLELQMGLFNDARLASRIKPLISGTPTKEDLAVAKRMITESHLSPEDKDMYSLYLDANRLDQLNAIGDQTIQTARDSGVFGKLGTTDTYETSASKNVRLLNDLENQLRNGEITEDQFYARRAIILGESIVDTGGGGSGILRKGETTVTPATVRTAGAGAGGAGAGAGAGGAVTPDNLQPPPPPTGAAPAETLASRIANADKIREFQKRYGAEAAKNVADLENTSDLFQVNKAGFDEVYPEVRLGETLAKAPDSRIGQIFSQGIGNIIQGLPEVDADYELEQAFRAAVGLIPFPPGAQSQAEQEAREREVGSLTDPKISKDVRLKGMARLLNREQTKAKQRWDIANRRREELGLPPVSNPFEKMTPRQGAGTATPAPTAIGGGQPVYEVDF